MIDTILRYIIGIVWITCALFLGAHTIQYVVDTHPRIGEIFFPFMLLAVVAFIFIGRWVLQKIYNWASTIFD